MRARKKRNDKTLLTLLCVLAAVLVLLILAAVILSGPRQPAIPEETTGTVNAGTQGGDDQTERLPLVIQTPYGELVYSARWSESLVVEQVAGTEHDVNFYAAFAGMKKIPLFTITFSPDTDGAMKVIKDSGGNDVGVYLHIAEVTADLGDEQMNAVYSMQEAVNDLLDQLA